MNKYLKIAYGVTILALVATYYYTRKKITTPSVKLADNFDTFTINGYTITKPNNEGKKYDVVYVFGGISYANKEWMKSQMPKDIFLNNIIVLSDYSQKYSEAKSALKKFINENNLYSGNISIIGFSAGGLDALENYSKDFHFFGLIDPSNYENFNNLPFGRNTYMIYNDRNWSGYPTIKSNFSKLATNIENKGGYVERTTLSHKNIPKYFFEKLINEIG